MLNPPRTPLLIAVVIFSAVSALVTITLSNSPLSDNAQARGWKLINAFHYPRRALAAASNGHYIYAVGGINGQGHYVKAVEYAKIRPDGTLGAWRTTTPLPRGRIYLAAAVVKDHLYALGGGMGPLGSGNTPTALVEKARIHADGSLGPWRKESYMTTPRRGLKAVVHDNHIYAIGGYNGMFLRSTERAAIADNGSVTAWTEEPEKAVLDRYIHAAALWRDNIYLLGGHVQKESRMGYGDVEKATITGDGSLLPWKIEQSVLQVPRFVASAFALGDYLYILGGHNDTHRLRSVEVARITPSGDITPWRFTAPLRLERSATALAVVNDRVYVLGGMGNDRVLNEVEMAQQRNDGQLGFPP